MKHKNYYELMKKRLGDEVVFAIRKERNRSNRQRDPQATLFYEAKGRAKKNHLPFNLEKKDIVIPSYCPVLGIPLSSNLNKGIGQPHDGSPTVDRVDNFKGYTKDNIRIISWKANKLKNNATIDQLERIVNYMKEHTKRFITWTSTGWKG